MPKKQEHITPILAYLHWLPVSFRIDLKIVLTYFKAQMGLAPSYISDLLPSYVPARSLTSSNAALLTLLRHSNSLLDSTMWRLRGEASAGPHYVEEIILYIPSGPGQTGGSGCGES